ncbi:MAG: Maf family nucleotide pyrophosphatase [Hyphomicrobium sp.]
MTPKSSLSQIILASTSRARREMLAAAGVAFTVEAADVDEPAVRETLLAAKSAATPPQIADALARAKAEDVSQRHKGSLVIGGDQVLALGTELLTKAKDEAAARATLKKLRGMTHELHSAVALAVDGRVLWTHTGTARLKMRDFSDAFLEEYLTRAGDRVGQSVGAYELEGLGVQLFDKIEGDYFTILGLPLLPLLAELRAHGMIAA